MHSSTVSEQILFSYIDSHKAEMLAFWELLVRAESPTAEPDSVNAVSRIIAEKLTAAGAKVRFVPVENRGDILFASYGEENAGSPILLIGHMDTVFPLGTLEKNPFRIDPDGKVRGPGALDMKGGLTIAVFLVKALAAAGYRDHPVHVIFASDEEELHRNSNAAAIFPGLAAGACAAFNFETGSEEDGIAVSRKGSVCFSMDISGVGAHAGNCPEKGRSAIEEAAHKVLALQALNDLAHGTSVNVGLISGGTVVNAVPSGCHIDVDVRYSDGTLAEKLLEDVKRISETVWVEGCSCTLSRKPSAISMPKSDKNMRLFSHMQAVAADIGYGSLKPVSSGGWSDSSLAASVGIPVVCACGVKGANNHTEREYAVADSLFSRTKLIGACILRLPEQSFAV